MTPELLERCKARERLLWLEDLWWPDDDTGHVIDMSFQWEVAHGLIPLGRGPRHRCSACGRQQNESETVRITGHCFSPQDTIVKPRYRRCRRRVCRTCTRRAEAGDPIDPHLFNWDEAIEAFAT